MRASCVLPYGAPARHTAAEVAELLAERMPELAHHLAGEPSHRGRDEWRFRSRGSLAVKVAGPKRGSWFDHEAGVGGDALGLVAHLLGCPMREAAVLARGWLGTDRPATRSQAAPKALPDSGERVESNTADMARRLWSEGTDPAGTLVARYLTSRGLALPDAPDVLRFHPACPRGAERWPAMLALMTDPESNRPVGVHRTFLARDGSGKAPGDAKKMCGRAGIIRLVEDAEVTMGLGLAEGIETSLAVMQGFGWRPVWAGLSAGGMARFPVLQGIQALTLFADADDAGAGADAARKCAERWAEAGREVTIAVPPSGTDFADLRRIAA